MSRKALTCRLCGAPRCLSISPALCLPCHRAVKNAWYKRRRQGKKPPRVMQTTCRVCGEPRHSTSSMPFCRQHYNEYRRVKDKERRGPAARRGAKFQAQCKICAGPRRRNIQYALCDTHYREMLIRRARAKGVQPRKEYDPTMCTKCDQPRTAYGPLCLACERAAKLLRRRAAGILPPVKAKPRVCRIPGCSGVPATRSGKLCPTCLSRIQRDKVSQRSRRKMSAAAKSPLKQIPRSYPEVKVGPETIEQTKPVVPPGTVQRIPAADAAEREAREREWAEYLKKRLNDD